MPNTTALPIALPEKTMTIDASRLRFFAKAINESAAVYVDPKVANCAGHPSIPVPPTFLFGVELECADPLAWLSEVNVDPARVLHGEQSFRYHSLVFAGETVVARPRIVAYRPKNQTFDIIEKDTEIVRPDERPVATLSSTYLVMKDAR